MNSVIDLLVDHVLSMLPAEVQSEETRAAVAAAADVIIQRLTPPSRPKVQTFVCFRRVSLMCLDDSGEPYRYLIPRPFAGAVLLKTMVNIERNSSGDPEWALVTAIWEVPEASAMADAKVPLEVSGPSDF